MGKIVRDNCFGNIKNDNLPKKRKFEKTGKRFAVMVMISLLIITGLAGCTKKSSGQDYDSQTDGANASGSGDSLGTKLTVDYDDEDSVNSWEEKLACKIALNGNGADISGSGAMVSGAVITISSSGTYVLSGKLNDGSIVINVADKGTVRIILNGTEINSSTTAPIIVTDAKKVILTLAEGTSNTVTDSARNTAAVEEYTAAISSKADFVINGLGTLNVNAGYKDGIKSSDDLKIVSGTINVTAKDDGIIGRDLFTVKTGNITVKSGGDGIKSTYDTDTTKGNIIIEGGTFVITAGNDGIQSENILQSENAEMIITTGSGGSNAQAKTDNSQQPNLGGGSGKGINGIPSTQTQTAQTTVSDSYKGLKAVNAVNIYNGTYRLDNEDDSVHTNGDVNIIGGTFDITTGDDGIHADNNLTIGDGTITVNKCYEGLEATIITVNGGDIKITASDDGMNAADSSSTDSTTMGHPGSASSSDAKLNINGGTIYVNAGGDGLDSNGSITMTGGKVTVEGPTDNNNAALDYDSKFTISGGILMCSGYSNMAQTPSESTDVFTISMTFTSIKNAGTSFALTDETGKKIIEYSPTKNYSNVVIVTADLSINSNITVVSGGNNIVTIPVTNTITYANESGVTTGNSQGAGGNGNMGGQNGRTPGNNGDMTPPEGMSAPDMSEMPSMNGDFQGRPDSNRGNGQGGIS